MNLTEYPVYPCNYFLKHRGIRIDTILLMQPCTNVIWSHWSNSCVPNLMRIRPSLLLLLWGRLRCQQPPGLKKSFSTQCLPLMGTLECIQIFFGNVATVYSHPLSKGGSSNAHYNGNAETYMNIGEAMGRAMAGLNRSET